MQYRWNSLTEPTLIFMNVRVVYFKSFNGSQKVYNRDGQVCGKWAVANPFTTTFGERVHCRKPIILLLAIGLLLSILLGWFIGFYSEGPYSEHCCLNPLQYGLFELLLPTPLGQRGLIMIIFCYSPKHFFRLIEGQQYHCWSEKSPAVGLEPPTLGIQGRRLHHSPTEPHGKRKSTQTWSSMLYVICVFV